MFNNRSSTFYPVSAATNVASTLHILWNKRNSEQFASWERFSCFNCCCWYLCVMFHNFKGFPFHQSNGDKTNCYCKKRENEKFWNQNWSQKFARRRHKIRWNRNFVRVIIFNSAALNRRQIILFFSRRCKRMGVEQNTFRASCWKIMKSEKMFPL